jgi:hypothetical protein
VQLHWGVSNMAPPDAPTSALAAGMPPPSVYASASFKAGPIRGSRASAFTGAAAADDSSLGKAAAGTQDAAVAAAGSAAAAVDAQAAAEKAWLESSTDSAAAAAGGAGTALTIRDTLCDVAFQVSPGAFFQVRP